MFQFFNWNNVAKIPFPGISPVLGLHIVNILPVAGTFWGKKNIIIYSEKSISPCEGAYYQKVVCVMTIFFAGLSFFYPIFAPRQKKYRVKKMPSL
jgi:hypothetical protein